jgi:alpha-tubulin suppressor-like RCC1 family protein
MPALGGACRAAFRRRGPRRAAIITVMTLIAGALAIASSPASAATISSVAAGFSHTCAVTSGGGVKCWGQNGNGELGNGTTADSPMPVNVVGLSSGVMAVSAGVHSSCALTGGGGVLCWGTRVGTGVPGATSSVPVAPIGLGSGVRAVSVGYDQTCALMTDASVRCWGSNSRGQLGDGTTTAQYSPMPVPDLSGIVAISSGAVHTCALTDVGTVKCWGYNAYGQVGNGSIDAAGVARPTDVVGLTDVASIATGGYHSCAITASGGAFCWGQGQYGELGDGTNQNSAVPVAVSGLSSGVASMSGGAYHTCAIMTSAAAKCWGANNVGSLGDGTTTNSSVPLDVSALGTDVARISGGRAHTCSVDASGRTRCWGWNLYGQVGIGATSTSVLNPTLVRWFTASFTVSCSGLVCDVADASSDPGGEIVTRAWAFGDGGSATGAAASHSYAVGGTYTISLTVSDGAGVTNTAARTVTITPWNLKAAVSKVRGSNVATLTWNAAATMSSSIDVLRNGVRVATTSNGGSYSEALTKRSTYAYVVCPTGSNRCSNTATISV